MDLHRHDEFSTFDGFGKASELAKIAKELGHTALGISNHGNTHGLVKHYDACMEEGIKPVLGVETYFLPKHVEQTRGFHLCLFAKDRKGYENINRLQTEGDKKKYYDAIVTLEDLEKYHEGVICTTACVGSYFGRAIANKNPNKAYKLLKRFKKIFGEDFYVEIQPYVVDGYGTQEKVNSVLMEMAEELGLKCILTSDSHMGSKEDLDTYLVMHEIAGHNLDSVEETYGERYMPTDQQMWRRFVKMHEAGKWKIKDTSLRGKEMLENLKEIEDKVDEDIFGKLESILPEFDGERDSSNLLMNLVKKGLKEKGYLGENKYVERCKEELKVIKFHGFEDYFLMVYDYTKFAKENGIVMGPGRGSACNCLVSWALNITEVDSIKFDLDYRRFIRYDKAKMPDIDLDFMTSRREEVIDYILKKYPGKSAQIISYGQYKVDNLVNDLAKISGLEVTADVEPEQRKINQKVVKEIKQFFNQYKDQATSKIDFDEVREDKRYEKYNEEYNNFSKHFEKLYMKVRFFGTHAAGVAIVGTDLLEYTAIKTDSKTGKRYIAFDLVDSERIKMLKFDILGLKTMEELSELRDITKQGYEFEHKKAYESKEVIEAFKKGNTSGIFQFESSSAKAILETIEPENFADVCAATSINRPGPLSLRVHETYGANKANSENINKDTPYYKFLAETYGTLIYQEQVQAIVTQIGKMDWASADKIIKLGSASGASTDRSIAFREEAKEYEKTFVRNAKKVGVSKEEASELFKEFFNYSFNKGHGTGYALISFEQMWYKVFYPNEFWMIKLRNCADEVKERQYLSEAVTESGTVVFLPHVNYSSKYVLRKVDGEMCIQKGLSSIKGVGEKASEAIEIERRLNGIFRSYDDFYDRCKSRAVTSRVVGLLSEQGALEFNKKKFLQRVVKYNTALMMESGKR